MAAAESLAAPPPELSQGRVATALDATDRGLRAVGRRVVIVLRPVTPLGRVVAAVGLLAWLVGWWLGWQEAMFVAAGCLVALVASLAFTVGRTRITVTVEIVPDRVVVGERAAGRVESANTAQRRLLPLRLEVPVGRATATFRIPSLGREGRHENIFVVPTRRRSVIRIGPVSSVRGDPLGLIRREIRLTDVQELFVHPRTLSLESLGAGFLRDLEGQTTNDLSTSDVAFHTLREYVPGDDRRHVHWKTTARIGTLMVRQFVDTRQSHLAVVVSGDPVDYADDEEFEAALSAAGSVALRARRDDNAVALLCAGADIPSVTPRAVLDGLSGVPELGTAGTAPWLGLVDGVSALGTRRAAVSVAILLTGSRLPVADLRRAAAMLPADVRSLAIRIDPAARPAFASVGRTTLVTLSGLDDLPRGIAAVMGS